VRIEEMINYFSYNYPQPRSAHPFSVTTEVASAPWQPDHKLVLIGLQGKRVHPREMPPRNLVFLLDVSGSMSDRNKLPLLKRSFGSLLETLSPRDRVAIVVYAGASGLVLPSTPASHRRTIYAALDRLSAGGSTNGGAGIELAYRIAQANRSKGSINRVILATDGDFNVGTTSQSELVDLIEEKRNSGVFLTVLGFGMGNYNDSTLERLADHGNGNYAYIDSLREAQKVLVTEAGGTLLTIAKDVKIQVEFNPAVVGAYRLIGYENRNLAHRDFNDDQKDAGDIGAGHSVTALYEILTPAQAKALSKVDGLRYQRTTPRAGQHGEMMTVKLRYKRPDARVSQLLTKVVPNLSRHYTAASDNHRFAAAVAGFGMILRKSAHRGHTTRELVHRLASSALGKDPHGYRHEFLSLVGARSSNGPVGVAR
jgi:Ca-activated chloride channel family protein